MLTRLACLLLISATPVLAQGRREVVPQGPAPTVERTVEVELVVDVLDGSRDTAVPLARAQVELGVGFRREKASAFWAQPVLARVVADEQGRIRATFAISEHWLGLPDARLWARVELPGWYRAVVVAPLIQEPDAEPPRLKASPGGTLVGTVLDATGSPVSGAIVGLHGRGRGAPEFVPPDGPPVWRYQQSRADSSGRFAAHYFRFNDYDLVARLPGVGSAVLHLPGLELEQPGAAWRIEPHPGVGEPGPPRQPLELVLRGGVPITGRVLDPAGHPVPGLTIRAERPEAPSMSWEPLQGEREGGLIKGKATSDTDGCFVLANLVPGDYVLRGGLGAQALRQLASRSPAKAGEARDSSPPGEYDLGVVRAPTPEPAEFVVTAHRLELSVVTASGLPAEIEEVVSWRKASPHGSPLLLLEDADPLRPVKVARVGDLLVAAVRPTHEYTILWMEDAVPLLETSVHVDWNPHRVTVQLRLGPRGEPAQLAVRVLGPEGAEYAGHATARHPILRLFSAETGRQVATTLVMGFQTGSVLTGPTWEQTLPPGRYRIELTAPPAGSCIAPEVPYRTPHLPSSIEVELRAGEHRSLDLQLGAGGHLDFEPLEPIPTLANGEWRKLEAADSLEAPHLEHARRELGGASVILVSATGVRVPVRVFVLPGQVSVGNGEDWIVQGWSARNLYPVPVGDWTLRLERDDELLLERPVTIAAGEVTTIRW